MDNSPFVQIAFAVGLWFGTLTHAAPPPDDSVIFTFATTGDCRYAPKAKDLSTQEKLWREHIHPLARILREIQVQKPDLLVFTGDMIMGQTTNELELTREYSYWRGMISGLLESGIYVLPVPGNHETQIKDEDDEGETHSRAQVECEVAWRKNMGDLILDTNLWIKLFGTPPEAWDPNFTPSIGGPDGIKSDQRQLTYSFDFKGMHFAALNTDAYENDSHAPAIWLADDFAQAKTRGCSHFFAFGHKMAYTYYVGEKSKAKGLDLFPTNAATFWNIVQIFDGTYFCGHEHIYHAMQPRVTGLPRHSWQVIVGSAGAPFEAKPGDSSNPNDRKYGWVLVRVHANGRVTMETYAFDEHDGPTEAIESIELTPPKSPLS